MGRYCVWTWSFIEITVGAYGVTRAESTVAPPYARLYVKMLLWL